MAYPLRIAGRMNPLRVGLFVGLFALVAAPIQGQSAEGPRYKFNKGDVHRYEVTLELSCNLAGSDPCFLAGPGGADPFSMSVKATFMNHTTEVDSTGRAMIERKVKSMLIKGKFNGEDFKLDWNDEMKNFEEPAPESVVRFWYDWTQKPTKFQVGTDGELIPADEAYKRLVNKMGAMYWPMTGKAEEKDGKKTGKWITQEEFAIPALHDHLWFDCTSDLGRTVSRDGKRLLQINTELAMAKKHGIPELSPIPNLEVEYKCTGKGTIEFDEGYKRLHGVNLDVRLTFSGKGSSPEGAEAPVKGVVIYKETQTLKE